MPATAREASLVWGTLMIATPLSYGAAEYLARPAPAVAVIMLVSAFKIRLILRHFMELKDGPRAWRLFFDAWTGGCAALIAGLCYYTQ